MDSMDTASALDALIVPFPGLRLDPVPKLQVPVIDARVGADPADSEVLLRVPLTASIIPPALNFNCPAPATVQVPVITPAVPSDPVDNVNDFRVPRDASIVPVPSVKLLVVPKLQLPINVPAVATFPVVKVFNSTVPPVTPFKDLNL